jgi:hypothetical protein
MKRREFNKSFAVATAASLSPFSLTRLARAATASGATQIFSYSNFTGSLSALRLRNASPLGSALQLLNNGPGHTGAAAFYTTQQPPTAFTTQFTFQPQALGSPVAQSGMTFCIQNVVISPGQSGFTGDLYIGDANMCGYGAAQSSFDQYPPNDSLAIKFDCGNESAGQNYPPGGYPSSTGMYFNAGPAVYPGGSLGLCPEIDLNPYGINFYSLHAFQVNIVYDGSLLTMTILDTTSNAQARLVWPLNLANTTNGAGNYVGLTVGTAASGYFNLLNWSYYSGFNTRLATPTFSPTPGQYSGTQTVTISFPSGSTCYYTTNGLLPTSSSTQYTGPITVSANEVIQAVALQSGYTDSLVGTGAYQIGTSNVINFPGGFAAGNLIPAGYAYLNGSTYRVSDTTQSTGGAVWFPIPVTVSSFSTSFTLSWGSSNLGMCFVIQNNPPAYAGLSSVQITGTGGQITFAATKISVGQYLTIAGTFGGSGSISGYANTTTYLVGATNGTTTATLQTAAGSALTTKAGTPAGLTYSLNVPGWSGGPNVVGGGKNAIGYGGLNAVNGTPGQAFGLLNSVAIVFNQLAIVSGDPSNGVGLYTDGANPYGSQTATGLPSVGSFIVTLTYSGTTLSISMQSTSGGTIFTHSWQINIPSTVGANTAYVGFTGGTYGAASIQAIQSWTYTASSSALPPAVPAAPTNLKVQ